MKQNRKNEKGLPENYIDNTYNFFTQCCLEVSLQIQKRGSNFIDIGNFSLKVTPEDLNISKTWYESAWLEYDEIYTSVQLRRIFQKGCLMSRRRRYAISHI